MMQTSGAGLEEGQAIELIEELVPTREAGSVSAAAAVASLDVCADVAAIDAAVELNPRYTLLVVWVPLEPL
ncbi:MAG: hypothetical protein QXU97_03265 [Fervidicoccaceae archaeon]